MSGPPPKKLLVEGEDDLRALAWLLEQAGIPWNPPPVSIRPYDGIEDLLKPSTIEVQFKESGTQAVGVLVDADRAPERIRRLLEKRFPGLPETLPPEGLVHVEAGEPRVGVWIMPDNVAPGMLESMLLRIRHGASDDLKSHVRSSMQQACSLGAPLRPAHHDKGELHTWLAWQEPPGLQIHMAVKAKLLRPGDEVVAPFVQWFRRLFEL
jgi:5S rRNA maturation endonuclease (ribonuclease M5)